MKHIILVALLAFAANPAFAKITHLNAHEIVNLSEAKIAKCKQGWGDKRAVTISTESEKFVFTYCENQPLSQPMSEVYSRLRNFVAGPNLGSCRFATFCDSQGRCRYESGTLQNISHQLTLITDEKNQIDADYNDIRIVSESVCQPLSCR